LQWNKRQQQQSQAAWLRPRPGLKLIVTAMSILNRLYEMRSSFLAVADAVVDAVAICRSVNVLRLDYF
jgi:hypothetical protein